MKKKNKPSKAAIAKLALALSELDGLKSSLAEAADAGFPDAKPFSVAISKLQQVEGALYDVFEKHVLKGFEKHVKGKS